MRDFVDENPLEQVGDAYIVSAWLLNDSTPEKKEKKSMLRGSNDIRKQCEKMLALAKIMLDTIDALNLDAGPRDKGQQRHPMFTARIGIGCGNTVLGTLGSLQPRLHVRGAGMEEAERLEQTGIPGAVHVSAKVLRALDEHIIDGWQGNYRDFPSSALLKRVNDIRTKPRFPSGTSALSGSTESQGEPLKEWTVVQKADA